MDELLTKKILIIDDEENNILVLESLLSEAGFTNVFSISDSRLALQWFREVQPDIVLLDLMMPFRSGFEVLADLMSERQEHSVPILVLTADASRSSKIRALSEGATDFLAKPLDSVEVILRINTLLELRRVRVNLEQIVSERTAMLARTVSELVLAQREAVVARQAKDRFIANMSHEIRTPISGIIGLCSYLAEDADDEELARKLSLVVASGQQLSNFMNDVLDLTSADIDQASEVLSEVSLWELVQDSVALHEPLIALKELEIRVTEPKNGVPTIITQELLLRQAVAMIISQSVKHTEVGSININIDFTRIDGKIEVAILVSDSSLGAISITSQALGVASNDERVSDVRSDSDVGFGLPAARRCLERIGGSLVISSSPVVGSQYLIRVIGEEGAQQTSVADEEQASTVRNVLIAEDNKVNEIVAKTLMERLGWSITQVSNGLEAVEAFKTRAFPLVLMDIQMPVLGGVEAARRIHEIAEKNGLSTEIVAFTANASLDDLALYRSAGIEHVLLKPVTIDNVRQLLQKIGLSS